MNALPTCTLLVHGNLSFQFKAEKNLKAKKFGVEKFTNQNGFSSHVNEVILIGSHFLRLTRDVRYLFC